MLAQARVEALESFPWSSYPFLAGFKAAPKWLETGAILDLFGPGSRAQRQHAFRQQLQQAAAAGEWETSWKERVKYSVLLGTTEFVTRSRQLLRGDRDQQTGLRQAARCGLEWEKIEEAVARAWNQPWAELRSARGSGARAAALYLGRIRGRLTLKELGTQMGGLHHNAVSIAIRRFAQRIATDRQLSRRLTRAQRWLDRS